MTLRAALLGLAVVAAAGCGAESPYVPPPMTAEATPSHPPEEAWGRVLKASVDAQGRVDFNVVLQNRADLDRYIAWIYERSPENWSNLYPTRAHVIAYHLNAYNALAMYNLLTAGVPKELTGSDRKRLLEFRKLLVGGQPLTMAEHRERIRALGEPRVHFALSGLLAGDPRLSRDPYRAYVLDQQLDRAARNFFAEERNLRVDDARRRIRFSPLLQDYEADFLQHAPSLAAYASQFRDAPLPQGYAVEYGKFDWTVHGTLSAGGGP